MTALVLGVVAICFAAGTVRWLQGHYVVVTVHGESMSPTYEDGQRLLVRRCDGRRVTRGQSVVYTDGPDQATPSGWGAGADTAPPWTIKRVAAAPGEPVPRDRFPALNEVVPAAGLVVEGDNPDQSYDSRHFGYLPVTRVTGVVVRSL
jgi:signal peptidase I